MITRRMFHTRLLAAIAATAMPRATPALASSDAEARLWLNRLTFGATPGDLAAFLDLGPQAWLDHQLALPAGDPGLDQRLSRARLRIAYPAGQDENGVHWPAMDALRPLSALTSEPATLLPLIDWTPGRGMDYSERVRPATEVIAASLIRAVHAEAQLREIVAQFWHDHFNVNAMKDEYTAAFFASHDALMRRHAFGNFRVLLGEVARSPAMLYYLNNADSVASPANENYARELLELHTLGAGNYLNDRHADWTSVPGATEGLAEGYLDLDVYEVARAFTGWSMGDGRWISEGETAPLTGRFHYVQRWHDPYQKRILGREFPPNRGPMEDGEDVLDMLAGHPGCARFICGKIARRFVSDDPPAALVGRLAETFLAAKDAPDQIAQVLRALVRAPEFAAPQQKLRRPFEFLAALYRAAGAEVASIENGFHWQLSRAGWRQHECGPPTGHPDRMAAWTGASTLNRYVDVALSGLEPWFDGARTDLTALAGQDETAHAFAARYADALAPGQGNVIAADLGSGFGFGPTTPARDYPPEDRQSLATTAIAFAALTPEFLLR